MATPFDIVTLFDCDNALLDDDQVVANLRNHLEQEFGPHGKEIAISISLRRCIKSAVRPELRLLKPSK